MKCCSLHYISQREGRGSNCFSKTNEYCRAIISILFVVLGRRGDLPGLLVGDREPILRGVQDTQDLVYEVRIARRGHVLLLLCDHLYVPELSEVEVPLLLEPLHGELHLHDLCVEVVNLGRGGGGDPVAARGGSSASACWGGGA